MTTLLPVEYSALTDQLLREAEISRFEFSDTKYQKIDQLKNLLQAEPDFLYPDDDAFLLQFLRARKFDVERAACLCRNFFRKQQKCPHLFSVDDLGFLQDLYASGAVGCLPTRDPDGCVVLVLFVERWNPKSVPISELAQFFIIGLMNFARFPATQIAGIKCIMDFKGLGMRHLSSLDPRYVWHTLDSMQNCIPISYRAFYIVNENRFFPYIWSVFKLFLSQKLASRFHFFGNKIEKLHEVFPPSILPEEFNGESGPHNCMAYSSAMRNFPDYMTRLSKYGYKEK